MATSDDIAKKMMEMFGDRLVDPDIFPRMFEYQAKLAAYELKIQEGKQNVNVQG